MLLQSLIHISTADTRPRMTWGSPMSLNFLERPPNPLGPLPLSQSYLLEHVKGGGLVI